MWTVIFYEDKDGNSEIREFVDLKTENEQGKIFAWLNELEKQGPILPRPYADILEEGIHELRIKLKGKQARILYFFIFKDYIVLTNGFIKTTDKVPIKQIVKSKEIRDDFKERYNLKKLKEELGD